MTSPFAISTDVPVLIPYRPDGGAREQNWNLLKTEVWGDCQVFEGIHEDGPFNRSAALNKAADLAGDWDVAIIADADSITEPAKIHEAIEIAREKQRMVFPFMGWFNVEEDEVRDFVATGIVEDRLGRKITPLSNSALFVVPRSVWDRVNGFDEHFVGWGFEDMAFSYAVRVLTGGSLRLTGHVFHMAHDRPEESLPGAKQPHYLANEKRFHTYEICSLRSDMASLVEKNRMVH